MDVIDVIYYIHGLWSTRRNQMIFAVLMCHWTVGLNSDKTSKVFTARRICIARICRGKMSVCPSVCHTPVLCLNRYRYPQFFSPSGSPTILVFHTKRGGDIPNCNTSIQTFICPMWTATLCNLCYIVVVVNFLSTFSNKKSCNTQQLYKTESRSLSAIAELLVCINICCFSTRFHFFCSTVVHAFGLQMPITAKCSMHGC